jgi:hypothetical protein
VKLGELNHWLGVITNIGVIGGLVLVAYEIRQNSVALEQQQRISEVEVTDGLRGAWQNWEYAIIENADVADIWMRGNAGEELDPLDEFRYAQLTREMFRLTAQNYVQYSTISGASADWVINQLIQAARETPRRQAIFKEQIEYVKDIGNSNFQSFVDRIEEIDPPELR